MKRWLGLLIGTAVLFTGEAGACRGPIAIASFEHQLERADLIFRGRIESVSIVDAGQPHGPKAIRFAVKRWWKGGKLTRITVFSDGSSCGFRGFPGQEWLILANDAKHPATSLLSANVLLVLEDGRLAGHQIPLSLGQRFGNGSNPSAAAAQRFPASDALHR
ncbi:MAG: hypothetical protein WCK64_12835 [Synechococcaceae cyanobacterium ELA445]|jgi:hypothetical protein